MLSILGALVDRISATIDACLGNLNHWKLDTPETAAGLLSWSLSSPNSVEFASSVLCSGTPVPLKEAIWCTLCADHTANSIDTWINISRPLFPVLELGARGANLYDLQKLYARIVLPVMQSPDLKIAEGMPASSENQKASTNSDHAVASTPVSQ